MGNTQAKNYQYTNTFVSRQNKNDAIKTKGIDITPIITTDTNLKLMWSDINGIEKGYITYDLPTNQLQFFNNNNVITMTKEGNLNVSKNMNVSGNVIINNSLKTGSLLTTGNEVVNGSSTILNGVNSGYYGSPSLSLVNNPSAWPNGTTKLIDTVWTDSDQVNIYTPGSQTSKPSLQLKATGQTVLNSQANPIKITSGWSGFPDDKTNGAEISNDTSNYKTLMIVGNRSAGGNRKVSVWDELNIIGNENVNGILNVNGNTNMNGNLSIPTNNTITIRDQYHGLGYGGGNGFSGIDGPVVYGYNGGALGSYNNIYGKRIAMTWDNQNNINANGNLNVNGVISANGIVNKNIVCRNNTTMYGQLNLSCADDERLTSITPNYNIYDVVDGYKYRCCK